MITGLHHVGLATANLAKTLDLLGAALEIDQRLVFTLDNTPPVQAMLQLADARAQVALVATPNVYLELFEFEVGARPTISAPNDVGLAHVCLQTSQAHPLLSCLGEQGFKPISPLIGLGGDFTYAYGRTREGVLFEVEETRARLVEPSVWVGHAAFSTHDLGRLTSFYQALTGKIASAPLALRDRPELDTITGLSEVAVEASWIHGLNLGLEFWCFQRPRSPAPRTERAVNAAGWSHVCFESDDIDADLALAVEHEARPHGPVLDLGRARAAYMRDPDGNVVELLQWREPGLAIADLDDLAVLHRHQALLGEMRP